MNIENKAVLSFREAMEYTGLSKSYLYKLTADRRIPHSKPLGGKLYFDKTELETWMRSNRVATKEELDEQAHKTLKCL